MSGSTDQVLDERLLLVVSPFLGHQAGDLLQSLPSPDYAGFVVAANVHGGSALTVADDAALTDDAGNAITL